MTEPNACAFPVVVSQGIYDGGLTKREYFAGLAMQGLAVGVCGLISGEFTAYAKGSCNTAIAERAVLLADYLLAELAKPKEATNVNTDPIPSPPKNMKTVEAHSLPIGTRIRRSSKPMWIVTVGLDNTCYHREDILADDWEVVP